MRIVRKGGKQVTIPLVPHVRSTCTSASTSAGRSSSRSTDGAVGGRPHRQATGPPGRITKRISPHSLRHSLITAALDAGVPLRDVQEAASHPDPRTTMCYDRGRQYLDRHATYVVAEFRAGAARHA
jgi:integrase